MRKRLMAIGIMSLCIISCETNLYASNYTENAKYIEGLDSNETKDEDWKNYAMVTDTITYFSNKELSKQAGVLKKGTLLVYGTTDDPDVVSVEEENISGFMGRDSLAFEDDIPGAARELPLLSSVLCDVKKAHIYTDTDLASGKLGTICKGDTLSLADEVNDFYKVEYNGKMGFVLAKYFKPSFEFYKDEDVENLFDDSVELLGGISKSSISSKFIDINILDNISKNVSVTESSGLVEYAVQFVGNPYVWGGTSLINGTDCSGFVQQIFSVFGIKLPRTSASQALFVNRIEEQEMIPGDLIFYGNNNGTVNHVAIFIGDGKIVHASNSKPYPRGGIKISYYQYRTPILFGRVVRSR